MAKIRDYIGYGPLADRPPAGAPGALYFTSDTGHGYRDNGTGWDTIANAGSTNAIYDATGSALVAWPGELITPPFGG